MTSPFNDDTSLCFGFNVVYWALLGIGNTGVPNLRYASNLHFFTKTWM